VKREVANRKFWRQAKAIDQKSLVKEGTIFLGKLRKGVIPPKDSRELLSS
jgi:hypothetical protein